MESAIQKAIVAACRAAGVLVIRMNSGQIKKGRNVIHLAPKGTPDLLAISHSGRAAWIETKTPRTGGTAEQKAVHEDLRARGQTVMIARAVDDVLGWLGE